MEMNDVILKFKLEVIKSQALMILALDGADPWDRWSVSEVTTGRPVDETSEVSKNQYGTGYIHENGGYDMLGIDKFCSQVNAYIKETSGAHWAQKILDHITSEDTVKYSLLNTGFYGRWPREDDQCSFGIDGKILATVTDSQMAGIEKIAKNIVEELEQKKTPSTGGYNVTEVQPAKAQERA